MGFRDWLNLSLKIYIFSKGKSSKFWPSKLPSYTVLVLVLLDNVASCCFKYILTMTGTVYMYNWLMYINAQQKQPGCKKGARPIRSHNGYKRPKTLISSKAKKLNIFTCMTYNSLQGIFTTMIGFVTSYI